MFLETIKINNGKRMNLEGHNSRMNHCRKIHFQDAEKIDLRKIINVPKAFKKGIVKCRVIYGKEVEEVTFDHYSFRDPRSFKLVYADQIEYSFKYENRIPLDELISFRGGADDIIIIKNGMVTDSYYANLAFSKKGLWYTPDQPLLKGTQRAKLIRTGKLIEKEILEEDIFNFQYLKIINASTEWNMHIPVEICATNIII